MPAPARWPDCCATPQLAGVERPEIVTATCPACSRILPVEGGVFVEHAHGSLRGLACPGFLSAGAPGGLPRIKCACGAVLVQPGVATWSDAGHEHTATGCEQPGPGGRGRVPIPPFERRAPERVELEAAEAHARAAIEAYLATAERAGYIDRSRMSPRPSEDSNLSSRADSIDVSSSPSGMSAPHGRTLSSESLPLDADEKHGQPPSAPPEDEEEPPCSCPEGFHVPGGCDGTDDGFRLTGLTGLPSQLAAIADNLAGKAEALLGDTPDGLWLSNMADELRAFARLLDAAGTEVRHA